MLIRTKPTGGPERSSRVCSGSPLSSCEQRPEVSTFWEPPKPLDLNLTLIWDIRMHFNNRWGCVLHKPKFVVKNPKVSSWFPAIRFYKRNVNTLWSYMHGLWPELCFRLITCSYPPKQLLACNDSTQSVPGASPVVVHPQVDVLRLWGHTAQTLAALSLGQLPEHGYGKLGPQLACRLVKQTPNQNTPHKCVHQVPSTCEIWARKSRQNPGGAIGNAPCFYPRDQPGAN